MKHVSHQIETFTRNSLWRDFFRALRKFGYLLRRPISSPHTNCQLDITDKLHRISFETTACMRARVNVAFI
jgi:hypothetical protein